MEKYVAKINLNGIVGEVYGTNPQDLADGVAECIGAMERAIDRAKARGTLVQGGYGVGGEGVPRANPTPRGQRAMVIPTDDACSCGCCANCGCSHDECCCDDGYCEEEPRNISQNIGNIHDVAWWENMIARQMAIDEADADTFGHPMGRVDPMGNY